MRIFKWVGVVIALVSIFIQCKKDDDCDIQIIEKKWKPTNLFKYENKLQTNSLAVDDKIVFTGHYYSIGEVDQNNPGTLSTKHFSLPINKHNYKPAISTSFFVYPISDHLIRFQSLFNNIADVGNKDLYMPDIDTLFSEFKNIYFTRGQSTLVNNQNQCLIPYKVKFPSSTNGTSSELRFLIAELGYNNSSGFNTLDTISTHKIIANHNINYLSDLNSVEEYFFVSSGSKTIRISPDFTIQNCFNGVLTEIFKHQDRYIGISNTGTYESFDKGLTWQLKFSTSMSLANFIFHELDHHILGVYQDQIFHFKFDFANNVLYTKEIVNEGLEDKRITSLALYNDKVYISTLSGIYEEEYITFFEFKEEE